MAPQLLGFPLLLRSHRSAADPPREASWGAGARTPASGNGSPPGKVASVRTCSGRLNPITEKCLGIWGAGGAGRVGSETER